MAEVLDLMIATLEAYPASLAEELSTARFTKMIYLIDWYHCIHHGRQSSDIRWVYDAHGPFVWTVKDIAESRGDIFEIAQTTNMFGRKKRVFRLKHGHPVARLTSSEKAAVEKIVELTRKLYWEDFIKLVYGTHPIASSERGSSLDLVQKAKEYSRRQSL
ncbi:Panacea domain-containing protein [Paracoccus sp. NSM]|uniref:Panacea domain-containing protein n=1 Tax=Paracoccus sp. NSM TaxID=3457784 RepID=UPI004034FB5A